MNKSIFKHLLLMLFVMVGLVGCTNNNTTLALNTTSKTDNPTTVITTNNVTTTSQEHEYGAMYYAYDATFLSDGNIAYYKCSHCGKYFDENYNEVESVVIPKLSNEISLYINGDYVKDFTLTEEEENHLSWEMDVENLEKDDVATIRLKNDSNHIFDFLVGQDSLINEDGSIHNDADRSHIDLTYTPNGLYLNSTGFEYEGITIIVTRDDNTSENEMNKITYDFGTLTESYVYGYYYFLEGDVFEVYDHTTDTSYGFDNVSEDDLWQTNNFEKNSDGKILVKRSLRLGVEFIYETKTILIDAVYSPTGGDSYSVEVLGSDDTTSMTKSTYERTSENYKNATFVLLHETTINNDDIETYILSNGYNFYTQTLVFKAGDKFRIKNNSTNKYIDSNHLVDLFGFDNLLEAIEFDGEYIKVLVDSTCMVVYYDSFDGFVIDKIGNAPVVTTKVELVISSANPDDGTIELTQNESNSKIFELKNKELLESDVFSILYNGTNYAYSNVDEGKSYVKSIISGGYAFLMVNTPGTYNISFNTETLMISFVLIEERVDNVLVSCKVYDSKKLTDMTLDGEEFKATLDVTAGMYIGFIDQDANSVDDAILSEPYDTNVIMLLNGKMIYFIGDANVTVYINRTTHVVRIVVNS